MDLNVVYTIWERDSPCDRLVAILTDERAAYSYLAAYTDHHTLYVEERFTADHMQREDGWPFLVKMFDDTISSIEQIDHSPYSVRPNIQVHNHPSGVGVELIVWAHEREDVPKKARKAKKAWFEAQAAAGRR